MKTDFDRTMDRLFGKGKTGDFKMLLLLLAIGVLVRASIGLGTFSGQSNLPAIAREKNAAAYGDFECHRLWIEITTNLNSTIWYEDTEYNNKTYWPMDYPPLCAFFHYHVGSLVKLVTPEAFVLGESYGHTSPEMIFMMRVWVIIAEFSVFVPSLLFLINTMFGHHGNKTILIIFFAVFMSGPVLYADHGSF